ncbi:TIGR02444 family protein [Halopseudomonas salegens]|uniref:TIGR02444 family protein n=1 Tax=Halopseudomonas salegens TaxID=1434072 RepID=A0A1H2E337_9GAMM|nr:TIGR02444 family protein [Halopseudomonas salegens]SDT89556.1 TIGR02444 family protein [Halopseudomonas salegens]
MTSDKTDSGVNADVDLSTFAARFYAQESVQQTLLELQDEVGLDVLLLLVACWLGRRGVTLDAIDWNDLVQRQQPWQQQVTMPLRRVRRALRAWPEANALREEVKASELRAEWLQLARLQAVLGLPVCAPVMTTREQLTACCQAQGKQPPAHLLVLLS